MIYAIMKIIDRLNTEQLLKVQIIVNGRLKKMEVANKCCTK